MYEIGLTYRNRDEVKNYIVLPHLLGQHKSSHSLLLSAYDVTNSNIDKRGWKTFILNNIVAVELTEEKFTTAVPGYNKYDVRMKKFLSRI